MPSAARSPVYLTRILPPSISCSTVLAPSHEFENHKTPLPSQTVMPIVSAGSMVGQPLSSSVRLIVALASRTTGGCAARSCSMVPVAGTVARLCAGSTIRGPWPLDAARVTGEECRPSYERHAPVIG